MVRDCYNRSSLLILYSLGVSLSGLLSTHACLLATSVFCYVLPYIILYYIILYYIILYYIILLVFHTRVFI